MSETVQGRTPPPEAGRPPSMWRRHYALPAEHGSWIWLIGPFVVGLAAARRLPSDLAPLALTALAAFLLRQPASLAVKAMSGRRRRQELRPAAIWIAIYASLATAGLAWLLSAGHARLLWLALPGIPVFAWHLWLVARRQERGQPGVEQVAAGVLALAGPAAYWTAGGESARTGWVLWLLTWLQAAGSIVYVHLRLHQRRLERAPAWPERWRAGTRALAYTSFNLLACTALNFAGWAPRLAPWAFTLAWLDSLEGILRPAVGLAPRAIGVRQLLSSALFILLLSLAYLR